MILGPVSQPFKFILLRTFCSTFKKSYIIRKSFTINSTITTTIIKETQVNVTWEKSDRRCIQQSVILLTRDITITK